MIPSIRIFRAAVFAVAVFSCLLMRAPTSAFADDANTLSVQLPRGKHVITFRRLPKIDDVIPVALVTPDAASSEKGGDAQPYELPSVYLAEKELSLFELKALLSEQTWDAYAARVLAYTGTDEDPKFGGYRKAVREASDKYPAILVDLGTVLEACKTLDNLAADHPESLSLPSDLAAVGFRLPSRIEWQYAARGTQEPGKAKAREVFPNWPQFDTALQGRWQDLCEKAGASPGRTASPKEVCALADSMLSDKQSKEGYEFLGEILKKALRFEVNIFRTADQNILPVDSGPSDEWGFRRLMGNASEWTIDGKSLVEVESLWASLSRADHVALAKDTRPLGVVMGGQFLNTVPQPRSWAKISVADGQTKDGASFSVQDAFGRTKDGEALDDFVNLKAGVRLCVRRSVSPRWFVSYRRSFRRGQDVASANDDYRESFRDLCVAKEFERLSKVLEAYELAPAGAEAADNDDRVSSITERMIAAARAFDVKPRNSVGSDSSADEAIRRLQALGLGGSAGGAETQEKPGGETRPAESPKRVRGPAAKPNYFDVLGVVNRS